MRSARRLLILPRRIACTAKTTIYCANVAAGLMLAQFTKWLRRLPVDPDLSLNLFASEIILPASQ